MSIVRVHPFADMFNLQREMNRWFDTLAPARRETNSESESAVWRPAVDIYEDDHSYVIEAELPGLTRDDVKINFQEATLTISGERRYVNEKTEGNGEGTKDKSCHRMERVYGRFFRSFTLPAMVNAEDIKAKFDNGVLTVTVPKAESVKPRQIEIA